MTAGDAIADVEEAVTGFVTAAAVEAARDAVPEGVAEGTETAVGAAERRRIRDRSLPRITIKNRRQRDMNLPRDSIV